MKRIVLSLFLVTALGCELPADVGQNHPDSGTNGGAGGGEGGGAGGAGGGGAPFATDGGEFCNDKGFCLMQPSLPVLTFPGIQAVSATEVWAVGPVGRSLRYDGTRWQQVKTPNTEPMLAAFGVAPGPVWAVGMNGQIMRLEAGQCQLVSSPTTKRLSAIWGPTADDLWAVGEAGTVLHYNGSSWAPQAVPAGADGTSIPPRRRGGVLGM